MMAAPNLAETTRPAAAGGTLLIGCGALAREMLALIEAHGWRDMAVTCLPAHYHNTPQKIPAAVQAKIRENRDRYARIFVLYGDCGTGGALDAVASTATRSCATTTSATIPSWSTWRSARMPACAPPRARRRRGSGLPTNIA
jgi:hypothetical protein